MSGQECFCAICGVTLNDELNIGSHQQSALRRRRELVRRRREGLPLTDDSANGNELAIDPSDDEPRDWDPYQEDRSYDPDLVSEESLEWLADVACVGYNPGVPGEHRSFLSEAEPYEEPCELILRPGGELALIRAENQPEETEIYCYHSVEEPNKPVAFPFHRECYTMLNRVHSATKHDSQMDLDLLYDIMAGLSSRDWYRLEIDYGLVSWDPWGWATVPGEEFAVTSPTDVVDFYNHLREKLVSGDFPPSPEKVLPGPASLDGDPFYKLSGELICEIALMVPYDEFLSLRSVSRAFYNATQSNGFRRSRITVDMPWLWELETTLKSLTNQIDYKKLYAWLEVVTTPKFGIQAPFLAIVNRRRVWKCCREILSHSQVVMGLEYATQPDQDMVAKAQRSTLFKVAPTQASPQDNISQTFWLCSEKELPGNRFATLLFETIWNEDGLLSGVGVILGNSPRFFGTRSGRVERARLSSGDWITEITLEFGWSRGAAGNLITGIKGIRLQRRSGYEFSLGQAPYSGDRRMLCVSEGKCLVGVEGQIRSDGVISRIGILEAPTWEQNPSPRLETPGPLAQRILWAGGGSPLLIWYRPYTKITPIFPPRLPEGFLEDSIAPYHMLLWAEEQHDLKRPSRVVAYTPQDPTDPTRRLVLGLRFEFVQRHGETKQYIGHGGDWPEDETTSFDLYCPLEERIVEIGVSKSETLKGIMFKTDWLRSVIFGQGEPEAENWTMFKVPDGDFFNGIAATFETDPTTGAKGTISSIVMLHSRLFGGWS